MSTRNLLAAAAAAAVLTSTVADTRAQETTELQIQSLWQAGSINQEVFERFAEKVETASDGRIVVTPLPVSAVVAHNETLEAVGSGILQGQHTASAYFSGRDPAFGLLGDLNGAYENPYQMTQWMYTRGGIELARELYSDYNLHYVGPVFWGMESIPMKVEATGVDDLQGVKLRMPEGTSSDLFRSLGASPVNIPGSEVYTSLERGVIDGSDWGTLAMNQDLGFHEIAQFPIYPGFHSMPMGDLAINLDVWNDLPDDLKAILELAVRDFNLDMIQTLAAADLEAESAAVEAGAKLVEWSPEERRKVREAAAEVWKDYSERSEMAGKIYESQLAFLRELGLLD